MLVRNKQYKFSDVLGGWTDALNEECPCRPCYHPHDYGYSTNSDGYCVWMRCLTREQGNCPNITPEPEHVYTKKGNVCKRCGQTRDKAVMKND